MEGSALFSKIVVNTTKLVLIGKNKWDWQQ